MLVNNLLIIYCIYDEFYRNKIGCEIFPMTKLKILHVNDGDLDDPRIINAAFTGKKNGFDEYFCGENQGKTLQSDIFTKMFWIKIPDRVRVSKKNRLLDRFWRWYPYPQHFTILQKQLKTVIDQVKPDIIHAHNIFVGFPLTFFDYPMILDDHEYYSLHTRAQNELNKKLMNKFITKIKEKRWEDWENKIGEKCPIITVSQPIANSHEKYCKNVYVVPNYPVKDEIILKNFKPAGKRELHTIYLGRDSWENFSAVRNINGLHELFNSKSDIGKLIRIGVSEPNTSNIQCFGLKKMPEAYRIMQEEGHVGLLTWKKHWFHRYCNPNKAYEYAHCGLQVIITNDFEAVIDDFGKFCDKISDLNDLAHILQFYKENPDELNKKRLESLEYARKNFVWEKVENRILEAYKKA